jgi:hypothetical protein
MELAEDRVRGRPFVLALTNFRLVLPNVKLVCVCMCVCVCVCVCVSVM